MVTRRICCPGWMEGGRMQDTIYKHDSLGVKEETARRGSRGFWAVSFWLAGVADSGGLWCAEPLKEAWAIQNCGSWLSCGAGSVTYHVVSQKICLGAWFQRSYPFLRVFRNQVPLTLVLHNYLNLLEPGASMWFWGEDLLLSVLMVLGQMRTFLGKCREVRSLKKLVCMNQTALRPSIYV